MQEVSAKETEVKPFTAVLTVTLSCVTSCNQLDNIQVSLMPWGDGNEYSETTDVYGVATFSNVVYDYYDINIHESVYHYGKFKSRFPVNDPNENYSTTVQHK